jgi:uncharacterized protein YbaP (TraB family)
LLLFFKKEALSTSEMIRKLAALLVLVFCSAARADPALWVAHGGSATVYLFGTIHVLPQGLQWMGPNVQQALGASSEVWTEADISSLSGAVTAIKHYGLGPANNTEVLLPAAYRARYLQQVAASGMPQALFSLARPWLTEVLLSAASMQHAGAMGLGAEVPLLAYAHAHHLSTPTFETLDQQFAILADMPQAAQIASLEEQIDEFDNAAPQFQKLLDAWKSGDVDTLDRLTNQDMRTHDQAVWTELILRRNERFAQKISERLQGSGTAFVAVGAAHLCGSDGVPAILRNQGFKVERVK